jgi:AAA domain, putative AbiEii toxin, Type IV TA system
VFVGPDGQIHGVAADGEGRAVRTPEAARGLRLPRITIQPQVSPLLRQERVLAQETIERGEGTHLAPQHFRNQLLIHRDKWKDFKRVAEESWPGMQVRELRTIPGVPKATLNLAIRDGDFVGEVSLMGHGLQMWLQTMWFLATTDATSVVVLDEPDVYMHPDLQRRLLSLVSGRFSQLIVATHSVEIIADVDPGSILSIDRHAQASTFVTDLPGVQHVIDQLGGVHNIQVTRLFRSRAFLLVEGKDIKLLRILQRTAAPSSPPIDLVPHAELGGRGGWASGLPQRLPSKNAGGERIRAFCVLDRDYFPDDEVAERQTEAEAWGVDLHVWKRKELENYLLSPSAISRYISTNIDGGVEPPDPDEVAAQIDRIVTSMKETPIADCMAEECLARNRRGGLQTATRKARERVSRCWASVEGRWALAPGKKVISQLSDWAQKAYGVSFGPEQLARELTAPELHPELVSVIESVVTGRRFSA